MVFILGNAQAMNEWEREIIMRGIKVASRCRKNHRREGVEHSFGRSFITHLTGDGGQYIYIYLTIG